MNIQTQEQTLIGGFLLDPKKIADAYDLVSIADFYSENAMLSYGAMLSLWKEQKPITFDTVIGKIGAQRAKWLADCSDIGSPASVKYNAQLVADEARKRRLSIGLTKIAKETVVVSANDMLSDILKLYNSELINQVKGSSAKTVIADFRRSIQENKIRGYIGQPTGFKFFAGKNIQFIPGHLWMIGGYTSTGKTAFIIEVISRIYRNNNPKVDIISTEMTREQLISRLTANRTSFSSFAVWSGNLSEKHTEIVEQELDSFSGYNFNLYDDIKTINQVCNAVRRRYLQGGIDIVFIDFIQNLRKPEARGGYEERAQIAIDLQNLAKDCRCTIVCLSQITASVHKSNAGIVEYKGAGELAEACDIGLWLSRDQEDNRNLLLEIRKNRHGMLGKQVLRFDDWFTRLDEHDDVENC